MIHRGETVFHGKECRLKDERITELERALAEVTAERDERNQMLSKAWTEIVNLKADRFESNRRHTALREAVARYRSAVQGYLESPRDQECSAEDTQRVSNAEDELEAAEIALAQAYNSEPGGSEYEDAKAALHEMGCTHEETITALIGEPDDDSEPGEPAPTVMPKALIEEYKNAGESNTRILWLIDKPPIHLPDNTQIMYILGPRLRVMARVKDGVVYLSSPDGQLALLPRARNMVDVRIERSNREVEKEKADGE